jgi:hypothetical protein
MSFTTRKWRRSATQVSNSEKQSKTTRPNTDTIKSKWTKKGGKHNESIRSTAFDSNRNNTSKDNTTKEPKFISKFIRKRDNTSNDDDTPMKTRTWKNKTSRQRIVDNDNNRSSLTDAFSGRRNNEGTNINDEPIKSKWSKARVKRDSDDGPFSRSRQQKEEYSHEPVKKSFNKKIVISQHQTLQQRKAAEKAVYDSFIKASYILKIEHGEKKNKNKNDTPTVVTDCWDSLEDIYGPDIKPLQRTEFDDWYDEFRLEIEGPPKPEPTMLVEYPWDGEHISEHEKDWYVYRQLNSSCMVESDKVQVAMNFYKVSKLDLTKSLKTLNLSQNKLDELMNPNTPVHRCDFGKMQMVDFLFDYNILNLSKCDDRELRKEFMKLRKKHNTNQRIALKIGKNMKIQKNEMDKYMDRYKVEFLMERMMYFDKYFMDGELNFTNNYIPSVE